MVSIGVYDQLTGPPNPSIVYFTTVARVQAQSSGRCIDLISFQFQDTADSMFMRYSN